MPKYRAQIIWDFEFDEKGITESEYDYLDEGDIQPRTPEEMKNYALNELAEALYNEAVSGRIHGNIDVIEID